jgi:GAF domain-containing protein/CheY-like chemotaxis protein
MDDLSRSLIDGIEDAVVVVDRNRTVVGWNTATEGLVGLARSAAVGADAESVLGFLGPVGLSDLLSRALEGQPGTTGDIPMPGAASDRGGWLRARFVPWRTGDGIAGVLVYLADVSRQRRRAVFLRAIAAVGHSLASSLDLNEVLDTITSKAIDVMGADSALVVSWDGVSPRVSVMRASGRLSRQYAAAGGDIPIGGGPVSRAMREVRTVVTPNILTDPALSLLPERRVDIEREGFKAVAAAPLVSKGRVHGALVVHYWKERTFEEHDTEALRLLAEHAALAIDNAHLYADATRRAHRLRELAEVEQMVAASLDVDDVLARIAQATARLVGASVVQVWTADTSTRALRLRASSGTCASSLRVPELIAFGEGIAGLVAEQRTPIYVPDVREEPRALGSPGPDETGIHRMLVVPILSGEDVVGVLTVRSDSDSLADEENRALVTSFAAQAGVAIGNARAYSEAVRRAARLRDLVAVGQSITASLDAGDVMQRIAGAAAAMRPGALAAVHFFDAERGVLRAMATSGSEWLGLPIERPAFAGLPGLVVETRAPVLVARPLEHPRTLAPAWWADRPSGTYYGVPIMVGDTFVGVLDYILPDGAPDAEQQEALRLLAAHAGVAIRNAWLYQAERTHAQRIGALAAINRRLSSALDLDQLLQEISVSAAQLTGVSFASFWLADDERRTLSFRGGSVHEVAADFPHRVSSYDVGGIGWTARHRAALVVDDVFSDPRMLDRAWWTRWGFRAFAAYPVVSGDTLLAVLSLSHSAPIAFTGDTRDLLETFIAQAAIAIQNARLYERAQARQVAAETIARLGRELTATLDADRVADLVSRGLADLLRGTVAAVYRYEKDDGTLHPMATFGDLTPGVVLQPGEGVAGRAVAEGKMVVTSDLLQDRALHLSPEIRARIMEAGYRAAIGIPLVAHERVIGALALGAPPGREFSTEDLQTLQAFADQAALALENATLYASARDSLARLRDTQVQLVQAAKMSALGQLVSGVAHELNNPLSVIIGYGQLMLQREVPADMQRPIDLMVAQADRMAKIVRNLLFFARQRLPERAAVNVNEVIDQTLALRQNQLTLSNITVVKDFVATPPPVAGDAQQLEQVFLNLLLNAEQAILEAKDGGRIVLRTRVGEEGGTVLAQVIDDGPGIPSEMLPRIFEPFFTTKDVGSGTGLGLSVSYGIIEQHGGRLSVDSRPGETVFTLELPVAPDSIAPKRAAAAAAAPARGGEGRVALVVEDEPSVLDLVVTLLQRQGWTIEVASGGRAALNHVRSQRYDLIVSDMRMPEGDGEELFRGALALDPGLARRFVFITGDTANPAAWAFLRGTSVPVVEKPFTPAVFLDAVRRVTSPLTPLGSRA